MTRKPLIGLTFDREEAGHYSEFPWYALRENYCTSITNAGGLPVGLPHDVDQVPDFMDALDGLIVTGGAFDVDPALFGVTTRHDSVTLKPGRTDFEIAITRAALDRDLPILGICGGEQLLNVALGGTLIQHIPDSIENALAHEQPNPRDEPGHDVEIVLGTRLHAITHCDSMAVNSAHHQAVDTVGPGIVINARAPDGVIEGIEDPSRKFCFGIEWHPEFELSDGDKNILKAFVRAATDA
ncbi:MAG: gamma-glutamyl-gamma-aminobutyrate hydrolase family protein [Rhodospirillales bacterium]|jgi:putative glutamine amidotransferase|nr:gamma-glutamyl-gamma-aminobutyrate hydrolase family protein [Rhodospirillales bacterium]MBT4006694.1 gamma-glutamyl-gamma-aminobutyrate hydrolase family protein [Rhodospirillales bacterium]MBT5075243.1 gamma-glutamyl-gamma-aminobutyrate hydrolase family protein [Rhodospirillales bacterium]MBT5113972.1 gamma-glutamyl-gamma-aminobutyrate hydrolase family protein [Rhodospirillales bacterium]MBT5672500.1 gamma-glutamyl-gamma-aminobutyrate hydrolase family protein [Rhodospirillales bacterium]